MIKFSLCFGAVRQMKLVGEDPRYKALRVRNEARLAALKKANRLTEDRNVKSTSTGSSEQLAAYYCAQQQFQPSNYGQHLTDMRDTDPDYAYFAGIDWGDRPLTDFLSDQR